MLYELSGPLESPQAKDLPGINLVSRSALQKKLRFILCVTMQMTTHLDQLERPIISHHEFSQHPRVFEATQKDLKSRTEHLKSKSLR